MNAVEREMWATDRYVAERAEDGRATYYYFFRIRDDRPIVIDTAEPVRHTRATWGKAALLFLTLGAVLAAIAWGLA